MFSTINKIRRMLNKDQIAVFDFDYTIAETSECVLCKIGKSENYSRINPVEFNQIRNKILNKLDQNAFIEFDDINIDEAKPIHSSLELMQRLYSQGCDIVILSARPQMVEIKIDQFMQKYSTVKDYTFIGLGSGDPDHKVNFIEEHCNDNSWLIEDNIYCIARCAISLPFKINYGYVVKDESHYKIQMHYNSRKYEL